MFVDPSRVIKWSLPMFFLLTTCDFTIVNETIQFTHGNEDFNFKIYIFTVPGMRMLWRKKLFGKNADELGKYLLCLFLLSQ